MSLSQCQTSSKAIIWSWMHHDKTVGGVNFSAGCHLIIEKEEIQRDYAIKGAKVKRRQKKIG